MRNAYTRWNGGLVVALLAASATLWAQRGTPDHPKVSMFGQDFTPLSIVTRNMGTSEDQTTAYPPHKVIDNIYYVGTKTLSSFLIVTSAGNILMDTTYERNVQTIKQSVEKLGFTFEDIKIILGNHAHGDHMEGDALAKELSGGAQVMAMAEDVPALQAMKPGGKAHPIDRILHDGDTVTLGNETLTAHLTPGHTHGCTSWTTTAKQNGKTYNVLLGCSLRAGSGVPPDVEAEFIKAFAAVKKLPCDVLLGDHPAQFDMWDKYDRIKPGAPNPYIDELTCHKERDIEEAMLHAIVSEQKAAKP